jgi:hypothetical protein
MRFYALLVAAIGASLLQSTAAFTPLSPPVAKKDALSSPPSSSLSSMSTRRQWLAKSLVAVPAVAFFSSSAAAAAPASAKFDTYNDPTHGFSMQVPADWTKSEQTLPDRRKILLWTDPTDSSTLVFIAYTAVRDDYTSLASFGTVDQVAAQTILPKGEMMGATKVQAEMLSAVSKGQAYQFDYKQCIPGVQPATHYRSIFSLQQGATGGAGAVLVTVTAQTPEERYAGMQPTLQAIVDSYGKAV